MSKKFAVPTNDSSRNNVEKSIKPLPPIPRNVGKWKRDERQCEWYNYIPHLTPTKDNRNRWYCSYEIQLMQMYDIITNIIQERYPRNKIKWMDNEKILYNVVKLVYHCSSKYISPYLENELKDLEL
jgi:hypothetical protein